MVFVGENEMRAIASCGYPISTHLFRRHKGDFRQFALRRLFTGICSRSFAMLTFIFSKRTKCMHTTRWSYSILLWNSHCTHTHPSSFYTKKHIVEESMVKSMRRNRIIRVVFLRRHRRRRASHERDETLHK